jgi:hypothetical protein
MVPLPAPAWTDADATAPTPVPAPGELPELVTDEASPDMVADEGSEPEAEIELTDAMAEPEPALDPVAPALTPIAPAAPALTPVAPALTPMAPAPIPVAISPAAAPRLSAAQLISAAVMSLTPAPIKAEDVARAKASFGDGKAVLSPSFIEGEHRVILHTVDGHVKRGTIRDADLKDTSIRLDLQTGTIDTIPMDKMKAIFFMAQAGAKPAEPSGQKIRVTFNDGRQVSGFSDDHEAGDVGFFMIPADARTNTARIYVFRGAVQGIAPG